MFFEHVAILFWAHFWVSLQYLEDFLGIIEVIKALKTFNNLIQARFYTYWKIFGYISEQLGNIQSMNLATLFKRHDRLKSVKRAILK